MSFYLVNTMPVETEYAFITRAPTGTELFDYLMSTGESAAAKYPDDARIYMDPDYPGLRLPDLVGNTRSLLIVSARIQADLAATLTVPIEYLSVSLYNHKSRLASRDYFIVNPLGSFDCLDVSRSEVHWLDGDVVSVGKVVLDPEKLKSAPQLFRIKEDPTRYVVGTALIKQLVPPTPTNFFVHPLEQ